MTLILVQAAVLIVIMLVYLKLAERLNIIDKPNQRSSHQHITVRGGGIVFPLAILLWSFFNGVVYPWFTAGIFLISTISFLDDLYTLPARPRLFIHLASVALLLVQLNFGELSWYWWLIAVVLIIGWINAFNFMDGINGITAFYGLAVLIPSYIINREEAFINMNLLEIASLSLVVFGLFNVRNKARCFAGDVGSVSMAFIIALIMTSLIASTGKWEYIIFLSVYGTDTILTIIVRLYKGENIFKAHRSHLYQYLANEMGWGHIPVALTYGAIQLLVSIGVIYLWEGWLSVLGSIGSLVLIYVITRYMVYKKMNLQLSSN